METVIVVNTGSIPTSGSGQCFNFSPASIYPTRLVPEEGFVGSKIFEGECWKAGFVGSKLLEGVSGAYPVEISLGQTRQSAVLDVNLEYLRIYKS